MYLHTTIYMRNAYLHATFTHNSMSPRMCYVETTLSHTTTHMRNAQLRCTIYIYVTHNYVPHTCCCVNNNNYVPHMCCCV